MDIEPILVKMVPFNKTTGHKLRRYNHRGTMFLNDGKWRVVNSALAEALRVVRSNPNNPTSPLAFLVMNESQAREWEQDQRRRVDDDLPIVGGGMEVRHPSDVMGGDPVVMRELEQLRSKVARQEADLRAERSEKARLVERLDGEKADPTPEPALERPPVVDLGVADPDPAPAPAPKPTPKPAPKAKAKKKKGATKKRGGKK